jgi:hypothetical protein
MLNKKKMVKIMNETSMVS